MIMRFLHIFIFTNTSHSFKYQNDAKWHSCISFQSNTYVTFSYATQIYATADLLVNVTVKTRVHSNLKYNRANINLQ